MSSDPLVPTAERTIRLIELFLSKDEGWTPHELLIQMDVSRSTLFLLLRTLKRLGYIEQAGKRGRYLPGPRLQALRASHSPSSQDLLTAFYQEAANWIDATNNSLTETLALALPAAGSKQRTNDDYIRPCLIVAQVESSAQVRSAFTTGQVYQEIQAAGQVLSSEPGVELQRQAYCLSRDAETLNLALPVCRDGIFAEAALLVSAPAFRWSPEMFIIEYLEPLRSMAAHLSYRLGAPFYRPYQSQTHADLPGTMPMDQKELAGFLRGPWSASLACIRPDGKPHVVPVWQEWDGEYFYVIAWRGSQWADYVQNNPHVSLTIDEPWAPLNRVVAQGHALALDETQEGSPQLELLLQRMARRYLGQPAPSGLINQVERAFRIRPKPLRGWRGMPGGTKAVQSENI